MWITPCKGAQENPELFGKTLLFHSSFRKFFLLKQCLNHDQESLIHTV